MNQPEELVGQLELLIGQVNVRLKRILPAVMDPAFTDSDVRNAVLAAERLSRWKRSALADGREGYDFAVSRATVKAKEYGEPFVVAEKPDGMTVVVVSKARFLNEKPFGLDRKHVVFETGKPEKAAP